MSMDFNTLDKEFLTNIFYEWYIHTYKSNPIGLYINLLHISDWNDFHSENECKIMENMYRGQKYSQYFTVEDFRKGLVVIRHFIADNVT